ncbi:MAG: hypothetical protein U0271_15190 [Polyangiaceae bacterium]
MSAGERGGFAAETTAGVLVLGRDHKVHLFDGFAWQVVFARDENPPTALRGARDRLLLHAGADIFGSTDGGRTWTIVAMPHPDWQTEPDLSNTWNDKAEPGLVRLPLPSGSTDIDGVPSEAAREAFVRLFSNMRVGEDYLGCDSAAIQGPHLAARCLTNASEEHILFSDDGGSTGSVILRTPPAPEETESAVRLVLNGGELLVARSMATRQGIQSSATVLRREAGRWSPSQVELGERPIHSILRDSKFGGFLLLSVPEREVTSSVIYAVRTHHPNARIELSMPEQREGEQLRQALIQPNIAEDGVLRFVYVPQRTGAAAPEPAKTAVFYELTDDLAINSSRSFQFPDLRLGMYGASFGLPVYTYLGTYGERVIVRGLEKEGSFLLVSVDGARSFRRYSPRALTPHPMPTLRCGAAGCDFELKDEEVLQWRWGSLPVEQTLTGPLSEAPLN